MDKFPGNDPNWLAALNDDDDTTPIAGDPYHPIHLGDTSEEEDPSEDEGILEDIPLAEGILEDAQTDGELEESLTNEEAATPLSSPVIPHFEPYLLEGKGPAMRRTPRISIRTQPDTYSLLYGPVCGHGKTSDMLRSLPDITPFLTQPICGHKRKAPDSPAHYEIGESSRPPPPVVEFSPASPPTVNYSPAPSPVFQSSPTPPLDGENSRAPPPVDEVSQALPPVVTALQAQIVRLTDRIRSLEAHIQTTYTTTATVERQVVRLEVQGRTDASAIQTLYHRVSAGRTEANAIGTRLQTSAYETQVLRTRLNLAERQAADIRYELNQLREQFDEVVRYLNSRA